MWVLHILKMKIESKDPKNFVPAHLGGYKDNIYNVTFDAIRDTLEIFHLLPSKPLEMNRKPLWEFVKEVKPERILEIGLGSGYNAKKMMELSSGCKYYCFDALYVGKAWKAYEEMKDKKNVQFFIGDTKKILPEHIEDLPKMDLIFIDGGHDYETVRNDWNHCKMLMHEETACFFHDYDLPSVRKAVDEIGDEYSEKIIKPLKSPPDFALIMKKHSN